MGIFSGQALNLAPILAINQRLAPRYFRLKHRQWIGGRVIVDLLAKIGTKLKHVRENFPHPARFYGAGIYAGG